MLRNVIKFECSKGMAYIRYRSGTTTTIAMTQSSGTPIMLAGVFGDNAIAEFDILMMQEEANCEFQTKVGVESNSKHPIFNTPRWLDSS